MADADRTLTLTHVFKAPRSLVFRQWTAPGDLAAWFAPENYDVIACEADARPDGRWFVRYQSRDGDVIEERGVFLAVSPPELLEFTLQHHFSKGRVGPQTRVRVVFVEKGGQTHIAFEQSGFTSPAMLEGNREGWASCFDKLDRHLVDQETAI